MAQECMQGGERAEARLHRDNSRFKFFFENGKPVLADDCEGAICTTPILHLIRTREIAG